MSNTVTTIEKYYTETELDQINIGKILIKEGERFEVNWDSSAKVTPMGSLVFLHNIYTVVG